jgi:hypothetical protein
LFFRSLCTISADLTLSERHILPQSIHIFDRAGVKMQIPLNLKIHPFKEENFLPETWAQQKNTLVLEKTGGFKKCVCHRAQFSTAKILSGIYYKCKL